MYSASRAHMEPDSSVCRNCVQLALAPRSLITPRIPDTPEDQHEWLEARRVSLQTRLDLLQQSPAEQLPSWLLDEWIALQHARNTLLHSRVCQSNWPLFSARLRETRTRMSELLSWPTCDSWDLQQLRQLARDWLLVSDRLQEHRHQLPELVAAGAPQPRRRATSLCSDWPTAATTHMPRTSTPYRQLLAGPSPPGRRCSASLNRRFSTAAGLHDSTAHHSGSARSHVSPLIWSDRHHARLNICSDISGLTQLDATI